MKTVMVFGTFDILHLGHVDLFLQAKKYAEQLIVVVARDERVKKIKGKAPIHSEEERRILLGHIDCVDEAILGDESDVYNVIVEKKPDIIALGYDQTVFVDKLEEVVSSNTLHTKVVRLKPYKAEKYKSGIIKEVIHSQL
ncbi:MAG: FAD synthase [Candidatus Magasanikbacteria bacterium]|jgi:FAD synthetase|nr:FAD synthase [Candidatus Magasanikbacteria bacterium]MBT5262890.1 FAD synthase [Candidatus Magasanikbacteria bacterium]MBT5820029.1 FAD synthase [Candidatus Magasanikbacteria bacterium]MBT6294689.1 FAD synthase [Candidatus Magasanikbacteria bacterium]